MKIKLTSNKILCNKLIVNQIIGKTQTADQGLQGETHSLLQQMFVEHQLCAGTIPYVWDTWVNKRAKFLPGIACSPMEENKQ